MNIHHIGTVYHLAFMEHWFPVNCYFIEEEDGLTLIDTGLSLSAKPIMRAAQHIGKPINRIVLTHAHSDHIGALDALKAALAEAKVYISERDALLLQGDRSLASDEPQTPIRGGVSTKIKTRPDVLLKDGDSIGSLQAITSPGHTPGSMSFLDTRSEALIAGDAFQTQGGIAVSGHMRWSFPFPALATWHFETAIQSAEKLLTYEPSLLAIGHGRMLQQPKAVMEKAVLKAKQRIGITERSV